MASVASEADRSLARVFMVVLAPVDDSREKIREEGKRRRKTDRKEKKRRGWKGTLLDFTLERS